MALPVAARTLDSGQRKDPGRSDAPARGLGDVCGGQVRDYIEVTVVSNLTVLLGLGVARSWSERNSLPTLEPTLIKPVSSLPTQTQIAALVGNGLSITFNPDLNIASLTAAVSARFQRQRPGKPAADRVLARLAARQRETGDPYRDFEAMIGPLDQQRDNLRDLGELLELAREERPVASAIQTIDSFVRSVRRLGVGQVLDTIQERSYAEFARTPPVHAFISGLEQAAQGGLLTVGNLNYDSLFMAGLCELLPPQAFCDMTVGYGERGFPVVNSRLPIAGRPLRSRVGDFPARRVTLLHLHGSLAWLRHPETGEMWRFNMNDLRRIDYWRNWRDGATEWAPEVVLTNQSAKSEVVTHQPFKLAYDMFQTRLLRADTWVIAGYSFRDECVNELLAKVWQQRLEPPKIMVVTKGNGLPEETVLEAVGYNPILRGDPDPATWLYICRHGLEQAPKCSSWARCMGQSNLRRAS